MVRLSKVARRRHVSTKRPKVKTAANAKCCGCSCKTKTKNIEVRAHKNALSGGIAATMFIPEFNY